MPIMRPPRRGISHSEALAAAYACATEAVVVLDTIELIHPLFVDSHGAPKPVRAVNNNKSIYAKLESTAPLNPNQYVTFDAVRFNFTKPAEDSTGALPEVELRVDNVSSILVPELYKIRGSRTPITMIWRPYVASDLTGPDMVPPLQLDLKNVSCDMNSVTGTAGFIDLTNSRFPTLEYTLVNHPWLGLR